MNAKRIPQWLIILLIMIVIVGVAMWLRITLPYGQVFTGNWVKMTGIDAYYYMRLVDNIVKHFPQLTQFDPYMQFPGGAFTGSSPDFFAYFMAGIIWILGAGRPDQQTVDLIAVYIPPILAMLAIIVVYFIGMALGSKWIGVMAAGLLAIMPGEFLNRSLLGYTDHHIAEILFSTVMMMFVFLFIRSAGGWSFNEMKVAGSGEVAKLVIYAVLAGIFMGLYLLTWAGALLFSLILVSYLTLQAVIEHLRGRSVDYLGLIGVCVFWVALLIYLPWMKSMMTLLSLVVGGVVSILLVMGSRALRNNRVNNLYYPVMLIVVAAAGLGLFYLINPGMLNTMLESVISTFSWKTGTTVMEMQPLLIQQGQFTIFVALGNYMVGFFLSLIAIIVLIYTVIIKGETDKTLLLVWSVVILLATLAMRRFAYYYAVNVSLLSGFACWLPISWALGKLRSLESLREIRTAQQKRRRKAEKRQAADRRFWHAVIVIMIAVLVLIAYYPNIGPLPNGEKPSIDLASRPLFAPSNAWCETLDWVRKNTPEPFGNGEAYYSLYNEPNKAGGFEYPGTAYGVLSWWDYGYWITRIGRRVPLSNPGTGQRGEAFYFVAQNEASADRAIDRWGVRYVIVDNEIAAYDGKFHALATLSQTQYSDYYDLFFEKQGKEYRPLILFYPEFYRSMVTRLYCFDGKEVRPDNVLVVHYNLSQSREGQAIREITERKQFKSYAEAERFIYENKGRNYIIASEDPYKSPVPLEELRQYKLICASNDKAIAGQRAVPRIKVFEYKRDTVPQTGG